MGYCVIHKEYGGGGCPKCFPPDDCPSCAEKDARIALLEKVAEAAKEAQKIVGWVVATSSTFGAYPSVARDTHDALRTALDALKEG